MTRSAEQIGRTDLGPRPIPSIGARRPTPVPDIVDTFLSNGLRLLAIHRSSVPMAHVRLQVPFGGTDPRHPARAHMLARTLLAGTSRRDRVAVAADLGGVGGSLNAGVSPIAFGLAGFALSSGFDALVDVLADTITDPLFKDEEVASEREKVVQLLAATRTQPGVLAREALLRHRYGDHPFVHTLPNSLDVIDVTSDEIRELHKTALVPRGATLVVVGDLDLDLAVSQIEKALVDWTSSASSQCMPHLPDVSGGDLVVVDNPGSVQSQLRLAAQGVPRTDPRYAAVTLANLTLAGYFSSRLNENLRENKGLCYGAISRLEDTGDASTVLVNVDTATESTAAAARVLFEELDRFYTSPPDEAELDRARRYIIGSTLIQISTTQHGLADQLAVLSVRGMDMIWLNDFIDQLDAVTAEDVAEVARTFFTPDKFTGVILGDTGACGAELALLDGVRMP